MHCEAGGRLGTISTKEMRIMATDTTTKKSWVQKTPGVCGGRACIRKTRITVWGLVNSRRLGTADDQILRNIVGLTPADLQAAWDYYRDHTAEIDEDIRENEED
jgi:type III restriction enzyme